MLNSSQPFRPLLRPPSLSKDGARARWQAWLNPISHLTGYLVCLLAILWATSSHAATTINVTTTNMTVAVDGGCGLTEALQAANTNTTVNECAVGGGGAPFTINLQSNANYIATTIGNTNSTWGNSAFVVSNAVEINGNGSTITQSGQPLARSPSVTPPSAVVRPMGRNQKPNGAAAFWLHLAVTY
jgi:hypothetical protein